VSAPLKIRARAPLRLGLAGGGTDVSPYCDEFGGSVLNATIDLYASATITTHDEGCVRFIASDQDQQESYRLDEEPRPNGVLALHKGVYRRIVREFAGGRPLALTISTHSDAPAGSGLGASSTLVVAMVKAFVELLNLPLGEYDIARLAFDIERVDLGLAGGRQDQYAAAFGGVNFMEFYANERVIVNPLRVKNWILSELESSIVLYYTGQSRESARIIEEQSARMRTHDEASLGALHALKEEAVAMKESLLKGALREFAESMRKGWDAKKRTASSISNSRIDEAISVALASGAYAAKISGAGGGGFVFFFVDPDRRADVRRALHALGQGEIRPCHFTKHGTQGWRIA
jgi:D-glycero-alpha-D-manno-heptose-7-phosphate kinase